MLLKVVFEVSEEGGYTALVPSLPGCISEGDTLEEARQNIRDAIELYLEPIDEPQALEGGFVEEIACLVETYTGCERAAIARRRIRGRDRGLVVQSPIVAGMLRRAVALGSKRSKRRSSFSTDRSATRAPR